MYHKEMYARFWLENPNGRDQSGDLAHF